MTSNVTVRDVYSRWRDAQQLVMGRNFFYELGGRDFARGMDCSGYASFVLSEIGLELPISSMNVRALWDLGIWSPEPDTDGWGRLGKNLALIFSTGSPDGGPKTPYAHVAVKYNASFYTEVTGRAVQVNGQQSVMDMVRNASRFLEPFMDGTGTFQRSEYSLFWDKLNDAAVGMTEEDMQTMTSIINVHSDYLYGTSYLPDPSPLMVQHEENGLEDDGTMGLQELRQKVKDAWQYAGQVIRSFAGLSEQRLGPGGSTEGDVVYRNVPAGIADTVTWLGDSLDGMSRHDAVNWIYRQLAGRDYAKDNLQNGFLTGALDRSGLGRSFGYGWTIRYLTKAGFDRLAMW
jgi:hypothetical protein